MSWRRVESQLWICRSLTFSLVFAVAQGKIMKICFSSYFTSPLMLIFFSEKKFGCVNNKSYKYFPFILLSFLSFS